MSLDINTNNPGDTAMLGTYKGLGKAGLEVNKRTDGLSLISRDGKPLTQEPPVARTGSQYQSLSHTPSLESPSITTTSDPSDGVGDVADDMGNINLNAIVAMVMQFSEKQNEVLSQQNTALVSAAVTIESAQVSAADDQEVGAFLMLGTSLAMGALAVYGGVQQFNSIKDGISGANNDLRIGEDDSLKFDDTADVEVRETNENEGTEENIDVTETERTQVLNQKTGEMVSVKEEQQVDIEVTEQKNGTDTVKITNKDTTTIEAQNTKTGEEASITITNKNQVEVNKTGDSETVEEGGTDSVDLEVQNEKTGESANIKASASDNIKAKTTEGSDGKVNTTGQGDSAVTSRATNPTKGPRTFKSLSDRDKTLWHQSYAFHSAPGTARSTIATQFGNVFQQIGTALNGIENAAAARYTALATITQAALQLLQTGTGTTQSVEDTVRNSIVASLNSYKVQNAQAFKVI